MMAVDVWYYFPAKPGSGYGRAVRGYAEKLAAQLGAQAVALASDDPALLAQQAASDGVPRVVIGAGAGVRWPAEALPPLLLKARPYADALGEAPSMHPLLAGDVAHQASDETRVLVLLANPLWLVDAVEATCAQLADWLARAGAARLMLCDSPRTNPFLWQAWCEACEGLPLAVEAGSCQQADNPYLSMLARADQIVLLGSSRAMLAEALLTPAPVYVRTDTLAEQERLEQTMQAELPADQSARIHRWPSETVDDRRYAAFDVTQAYVNEALAQLHARRHVA